MSETIVILNMGYTAPLVIARKYVYNILFMHL